MTPNCPPPGRKRLRFAERRKAMGLSQERLAEAVRVDPSTVARWERGETEPQAVHRPKLARVLHLTTEEVGKLLAEADEQPPVEPVAGGPAEVGNDELDALELARRVEASDVSPETLQRIEAAVDELAMAYATTPPSELLQRVRHHLGYVGRLLDVRATLGQQRRLLAAGGWLSLLAATTHIDLRQSAAARARLRTAAQLAGHAEHPEIEAWCLETQTWDVLTGGDYRGAVDLAQQAQAVAPRSSSAHIQATAQEGRAYARMRQQRQTREVLDRVGRLTSSLDMPDQPEHHYRYDPDKALSYTATTLAWARDPAAEQYARALIRQLAGPGNGVPRPRRVASARLGLALALLEGGGPAARACPATTVRVEAPAVVAAASIIRCRPLAPLV